LPSTVATSTIDPNVSFDKNGQQIISLEVHDSGYSASSFTVEAGKPTWLYANVPSQLSGCISSMAIPSFNILQPLNVGTNWIGPITPKKDFAFMCSMGMFKANVHVQQS
jgi:plastocyanin domain-containing protein